MENWGLVLETLDFYFLFREKNILEDELDELFRNYLGKWIYLGNLGVLIGLRVEG